MGLPGPCPGEDLPAWSAAWNPDPAWALVASVAPRSGSLVHAAVAHRAWIAPGLLLLGGRRVPPLLDGRIAAAFGRWARQRTVHPPRSHHHISLSRSISVHRQIHDDARSRHRLRRATGPNVADAQAEVNEAAPSRGRLLDTDETCCCKDGRVVILFAARRAPESRSIGFPTPSGRRGRFSAMAEPR